MKKVVIDTDIGDDIDDAFALALAATLKKTEIVGITTVFRNTADRAQQTEKLLSVIGKDVPVYAGERFPYKEPFHPFQKDGDRFLEKQHICQWQPEYSSFPVTQGAVDFLVECAEKYGDELIVVSLAAMTNIARAMEKNPAALKSVDSIVAMGGWFTKCEPEWNILCDPEAADIVFCSGVPLYMVGLDVTLRCVLDKDLLGEFRSSETPCNRLLTLWLDRWFAYFSFEKSVMHDPLAVATLEEDVCKFEKKYVKVDTTNRRGVTLVSKEPAAGYVPVNVAVDVDSERFYRLLRTNLLEN